VSNISKSPLESDQEFEKAVAAATSAEEIKQILRDRALATSLVTPDPFDDKILHVVEQPASTKIVRSISVDGQTFHLEGNSEAEITAKELEVLRGLKTQSSLTFHRDADRDERGRFTADQGKADEAEALRISNAAELELKFKRGDISTADYLEQSGALATALDKHLERVTAQKAENETVQQSWAAATTEFRRTHPEWDQWATEENKMAMAQTLEAMGAADEPSAENMSRAYAWLLENKKLVESPTFTVERQISEARTPQELDEILGKNERARNSMFGR
jgi:hypothetical protein